jgi:hypothetical protein
MVDQNKLAELIDEFLKKDEAEHRPPDPAAVARAGTVGDYCFFCGRTDRLVENCNCGFPEHFGCGLEGRRICSGCAETHRKLADHLRAMFEAKIVGRISSIRHKRFRELHRAARAFFPDDDLDATVNPKTLHFQLSQADAFDDTPDVFRAKILRAFQRSKFLRFAELARKIEEEKDDPIVRAMVRSGLFRR